MRGWEGGCEDVGGEGVGGRGYMYIHIRMCTCVYTVYKCEKVGEKCCMLFMCIDTGCMGKNRTCNTFPF